MLFLHLSLAILELALGVHAQGENKWEFYAFSGLPGMLSYGRLDPIISSGAVSSHVHQIQGANAMSASYDYDTLRAQSTCTTLGVQEDKSNYWAPALYHYDGASNFSLILSGFHIYYEFTSFSYDPLNPSGSSQRYPFPKGLTMLAGDMYQRTINYSDPTSTASIFQCQRHNGDSPGSHDIRDFQRSGVNCDNSLRATTVFPSCWDGVADNSDRTHVVYPGAGNVCPQSHPKALMRLVFEWYWPVQDFPFDPAREDNWVFSFGDTSGYGLHGDFANGWNIPLMEAAIAACDTQELGIENCAPFAPWQEAQVPPCMPSGLYPNENVGLDGQSLTALPGCNPLWTDNSTKPTCDVDPVTPPIDLQLGPDLSEWNYVSCPFSWTDSGIILTAHSRTNWTGMTADTCLEECKGYKYAMAEWGNNCYCDNEIRNGGSILSDPKYACQVRCTDKYMQFCGGLGSGELFEACQGDACHANKPFLGLNAAPSSVPSALPAPAAVTVDSASTTSTDPAPGSSAVSSSPVSVVTTTTTAVVTVTAVEVVTTTQYVRATGCSWKV